MIGAAVELKVFPVVAGNKKNIQIWRANMIQK